MLRWRVVFVGFIHNLHFDKCVPLLRMLFQTISNFGQHDPCPDYGSSPVPPQYESNSVLNDESKSSPSEYKN
jgi:hypothetical protein